MAPNAPARIYTHAVSIEQNFTTLEPHLERKHNTVLEMRALSHDLRLMLEVFVTDYLRYLVCVTTDTRH